MKFFKMIYLKPPKLKLKRRLRFEHPLISSDKDSLQASAYLTELR